MSFQTHLRIFVMCITLSVLAKISSVSGLDCTYGYDPEVVSACIQASDKTYNCPPNTCGNAGHTWIQMNNCVPYPNGSGKSSQQCVKYNYLDANQFTCENQAGATYQCPHVTSDRPVISCADATCKLS